MTFNLKKKVPYPESRGLKFKVTEQSKVYNVQSF